MNILDKTIGYFNPKLGLKRANLRHQLNSMERRFEGAADGRRHANWLMKTNPSVNQLIQKDLKTLVARSRELNINNGYARKAPKSIANYVVGTGILPTPVISLKPGAKPKQDAIDAISAAWKEWADNIQCDYAGDYNFYGMQHLAMRTVVVSGEILAIRKFVKSDVNKFGIQVLLLEADYIDTQKVSDKDSDGGFTFYGIKYDAAGKRSGYWIFDRHPSEASAKSILIPIKDVVHLYDVDRAGQNRGVPASSSTLLKQRDLDDYEDAELLGKKAAACLPIFVTNSDVESTDDNEKIENLEPGAINYLNQGESIQFASPPQSNGYAEFTKTHQRAIAAGYLQTYESFTGDYSNVNFSSGRMGHIDMTKQIDTWQYLMMIPKFCDPIFAWFIEQYKVLNSIDKLAIITASWTAPRRDMIDPLKEAGAKRLEMRAGLTSWSEMVRRDGYDPKQVLEEMKTDLEAFIAAGVISDFTPYFEMQMQALKVAASANKATPPKEAK